MSQNASHYLHSGYFHPVLREWSANYNMLTKSALIYPVFITDDADASVEIKTLPGQYRVGVNKLKALLDPLVKKGLKTILLFGVPELVEKVGFVFLPSQTI